MRTLAPRCSRGPFSLCARPPLPWFTHSGDQFLGACKLNRVWFDLVFKDVPGNVTYVFGAIQNVASARGFENLEGSDPLVVDGKDRVPASAVRMALNG